MVNQSEAEGKSAQVTDNNKTPTAIRRFLRALKPGFRPKWWDFLFSGGLFLLALPVVVYLCWIDEILSVVWGLGLTFVFGAPAALLLLAVCWKIKGTGMRVFQRILLQVFLSIAMGCPILIFIGLITNDASIQASIRRGDEIVAVLKEYRKTHWRYPKSLEALEQSIGRSLPSPSITDKFHYQGGWRNFKLRFHYGILQAQEYDSKIGRWREPEGGMW